MIELCTTFNWTKIAVVYVNDNYGLYLSLGIQELSIEANIDVTSIAISYEDESTFTHSAKQIRDLGIYIVILIIHTTGDLFAKYEEQGIIGYPYFYLGLFLFSCVYLSINEHKNKHDM